MNRRVMILGCGFLLLLGLGIFGLPTYLLGQAKTLLAEAKLDPDEKTPPGAGFYEAMDRLETVSKFPGFRGSATDVMVNSALWWQGRYINACEDMLNVASDKRKGQLRAERDAADENATTDEEKRAVSAREYSLQDKRREDRGAHRWRLIGVSNEHHDSFCGAWRRFGAQFANSPSVCKMCREDVAGE
jgi:hypothetical protein